MQANHGGAGSGDASDLSTVASALDLFAGQRPLSAPELAALIEVAITRDTVVGTVAWRIKSSKSDDCSEGVD
jgi:hypothetical protein